MTKLELMNYCWSRDFNYDVDLFRVAHEVGCKDYPTRTEYLAYCEKAFKDMLKWMDQQYEDTRTPEQRAKQELGITWEDCER